MQNIYNENPVLFHEKHSRKQEWKEICSIWKRVVPKATANIMLNVKDWKIYSWNQEQGQEAGLHHHDSIVYCKFYPESWGKKEKASMGEWKN